MRGSPRRMQEDGGRRAGLSPEPAAGTLEQWGCAHPQRFVFLTVPQRLCLWYDCK